jgi:hypothetical protein
MAEPMIRLAVAVAIVIALASCSSQDEEPEDDPALVAMELWRDRQTEQECPHVPQDEEAKDLVRSAQESGNVKNVYGEDDPYDRREQVLMHLWSRPNPNGEGVIVTAVKDASPGGLNEVDHARNRAVWLVLDGTIYPLNTHASGAHGVLSSGLPVKVAGRAGITEHAVDLEEEIGIEDYITYEWDGPEDPLPVCG